MGDAARLLCVDPVCHPAQQDASAVRHPRERDTRVVVTAIVKPSRRCIERCIAYEAPTAVRKEGVPLRRCAAQISEWAELIVMCLCVWRGATTTLGTRVGTTCRQSGPRSSACRSHHWARHSPCSRAAPTEAARPPPAEGTSRDIPTWRRVDRRDPRPSRRCPLHRAAASRGHILRLDSERALSAHHAYDALAMQNVPTTWRARHEPSPTLASLRLRPKLREGAPRPEVTRAVEAHAVSDGERHHPSAGGWGAEMRPVSQRTAARGRVKRLEERA
jgi:hypothetical protein